MSKIKSCFAIMVCLFLFTGSTSLFSESIAQVVRQHIKAMKERDYLTAYHTLGSKHFRNEITILELQRFVDENQIPVADSTDELGNVQDFVDKGGATVYLKRKNEIQPLEYQLVLEDGEWRVWSLTLQKIVDEKQVQIVNDSTSLIYPINRMFEDLENNNLSYAYFATSIEFQRTTPFDTFKEFVIKNPALISHQMTLFEKGEINGKRGVVKVNLRNDQGMTPVDFELVFKEGGWKIIGIEVEKTSNENSSNTLNKAIAVIESQLSAIRRGNISKAYADFMAKTYRDVTPLEAFEQIIEENSQWKDKGDLNFSNALFNFKQGTLEGTFKTAQGKVFPVAYELINENGEWKISKRIKS